MMETLVVVIFVRWHTTHIDFWRSMVYGCVRFGVWTVCWSHTWVLQNGWIEQEYHLAENFRSPRNHYGVHMGGTWQIQL